MEEVKLFGYWASPFSQRVIWALKLKGVSYEYIEEDLPKKSNLLLHYNPVHKMVPVLVHGGKPIAESMVILEYIDETWPENPLLPEDAYERSVIRFWAKFIDDKIRSMWGFFATVGETKEEAIKHNLETLSIIEKQGLGEKKFFGGDTIGLADIALGWIVHLLKPMEEIVGVKFIQANTFPRLHAWVENFRQLPVIKENLPDHSRLLEELRRRREMVIKSP